MGTLMEAENMSLEITPAAMICGKGLAITGSIWFNDIFVTLIKWLLGE